MRKASDQAPPVGGDVAEVVGDEQRNAQVRVVVMQFERDGHFSVPMIYGTGRNTLEGAGGEGEGERQAACGKDLTQHGAAFVDGDSDIS